MLRSRNPTQNPLKSRSRTTSDETRPVDSPTTGDVRLRCDWKGWVVLTWVLWFGLSYGKMVIAQRSDKISSLVARLMSSI